MIAVAFYQARSSFNLQPGQKSALNALPIFWLVASTVLAGSGGRTEAPFRAQKGLHGSMYFTLGLPVSRARLLIQRSLVGLLASSGVIVGMCWFAWLTIPAVSAQVQPHDALASLVTVLLASFGFLSLSTLLSTVLDQQWQIFASMGAIGLVGWIFQHGWLPASADVIKAMGNASPLVTHHMQQTPLFVSVAAGALFFMGALKIVQEKKY